MSVTAKTIILDIADNWGYASAMSVRSVDFKLSGALIDVYEADITAYATTSYTSLGFYPWKSFDTTLSKIGNRYDNCWISSNGNPGSQRLICVFDTPIEFDEIVINNYHSSGGSTDYGIKNTKIYRTDNTVTDTTYNAAISGGVLLFDGVVDEHVSDNVIDDQTVFSSTFDADVSITINATLSDTIFNLDFPVSTAMALDVDLSHSVGYPFSPILSIDMLPGLIFSTSYPISLQMKMDCVGPFELYYPVSATINIDIVAEYTMARHYAPELTIDAVPELIFSILYPISAHFGINYSGSFGLYFPVSQDIVVSCNPGIFSLTFPTSMSMVIKPLITHGTVSILDPTPEQLYPARVVTKKYRCMLGTLNIPISTFQIRARNGAPTFLQVSTTRWDLSDDITDRATDEISIHIDYYVDGVAVGNVELAEVAFDSISTYEGPTSKSIVLSGYKTVWKRQPMAEVSGDYTIGEGEIAAAGVTGGVLYPPPNSVTISDDNVSLISTIGGLTSLELVETDFNLKVGDIVHHSGSASFFANIITHTVGSSVHKIYVSE